MKGQIIMSIAVASLFALTVACTKTDEESGSASAQAQTLDELIELTRTGPASAGDRPAGMTRSENCESSEELERSIREAEAHLDQLSLRYTELHPEVIRARRTLDELVQSSLSECVERILSE